MGTDIFNVLMAQSGVAQHTATGGAKCLENLASSSVTVWLLLMVKVSPQKRQFNAGRFLPTAVRP